MSKNSITLNIYDGSEGMEYIVHKNGDVNITTIHNGGIESEVDVDVECFGFETPEGLIADLIDQLSYSGNSTTISFAPLYSLIIIVLPKLFFAVSPIL